MELDNISLDKGIHRTPSIGDASELSECVNLMPQYGEMRNIEPPMEVEDMILCDGEILVYVHERGGRDGYRNLIVSRNSSLCWGELVLTDEVVNSVTSIGNTLCIATEKGIIYYLFQDGNYKYLSKGIPDINFLLTLHTGFFTDSDKDSEVLMFADDDRTGIVDNGGGQLAASESARASIEGHIYAKINRCEGWLKKCGAFSYPFFIRYAIRLYDQTYHAVSMPILMCPNKDGAPVVFIHTYRDAGGWHGYFHASLTGAKILYKLCESINIDDWKDIIAGVDIFVSTEFQRYKEQGQLKSRYYTCYTTETPTNTRCSTAPFKVESLGVAPSHGTIGTDVANPEYRYLKIREDEYGDVRVDGLPPTQYYPWGVIPGSSDVAVSKAQSANYLQTSYATQLGADYRVAEIPLDFKDDNDYAEEIMHNNTFYKVAELTLTDVAESTEWRLLDIKPDILQSLSAQTSLSNSLQETSLRIVSTGITAYNSRLIVYNPLVTENVSAPTGALVQYMTDSVSDTEMFVEVAGQKGNRIFRFGEPMKADIFSTYMRYIYVPYDNARKLYVAWNGDVMESELYKHTLLKGYITNRLPEPSIFEHPAFDDRLFSSFTWSTKTLDELRDSSEEAQYDEGNRIYLSAADNPFQFDSTNVVTLPSRVLAVSPLAQALSQGQFGDFPLIAFCEDGIWALKIAADGVISVRQPISRDVILDNSKPLMLDKAIVYATKEGLKMLSGADSECISTPLHGYNVDESVIGLSALLPDSHKDLVCPDGEPFFKSIADGDFMALYDAPHSLIHLLPKNLNELNTHYVYSLKSQQWSMQRLEDAVTTVVPGYPLSYLQMGKRIFTYDHLNDADTLRKGYFLTRSTFLGNAWSRKALYDLRVMGQRLLPDSSWQVIVLISNDGMHWTRLKSLKAGSCRYYRFLVYSNLCDADTISGITLQYEERYTGKLR